MKLVAARTPASARVCDKSTVDRGRGLARALLGLPLRLSVSPTGWDGRLLSRTDWEGGELAWRQPRP